MNSLSKTDSATRLGEIIEASTTEFTTQCYHLYEAPPLGSLVRCGDDSPIYGIVCEVATRSMDPARHPIPRGFDEDTEEGVYLSNPQLNRLLYTEFRAIVVGHKNDNGLRRYLPPYPPRIHSFVYECGGDDLAAFSSSLEFLPIIMSASISAHDDVIASFLRNASKAHPDPQAFLVSAGKELAVLMAGQLTRLNNVLRRLSW
jgi:hypothetical protein